MAAEEDEPIRLNSSSNCSICNQRRRRYLSDARGNSYALCDICDCDANNPMTYVKRRKL